MTFPHDQLFKSNDMSEFNHVQFPCRFLEGLFSGEFFLRKKKEYNSVSMLLSVSLYLSAFVSLSSSSYLYDIHYSFLGRKSQASMEIMDPRPLVLSFSLERQWNICAHAKKYYMDNGYLIKSIIAEMKVNEFSIYNEKIDGKHSYIIGLKCPTVPTIVVCSSENSSSELHHLVIMAQMNRFLGFTFIEETIDHADFIARKFERTSIID